MKKKGVLIFIFLIIVAIVVTVVAVSCGAGETDKMFVYNLLTTKDREVVVKAREEQTKYDGLIQTYSTTNEDELKKVNDLAISTTNIIEELTSYVLFVQNTDISAKKVQAAYDNYLSAQTLANDKLQEAVSASNAADWEAMFNVLIDRYSDQVEKYNAFANELFIYTTKACFANNPKTVKYTTLSFMQGFNSYMIQEYVGGNKLTTASFQGINEINSLYNKYKTLKDANTEISFNGNTSELSIKFIDAFYTFKDMNELYDAFSRGMSNLKSFAQNNVGYTGNDILVQVQAKMDIYNFISLSSFV